MADTKKKKQTKAAKAVEKAKDERIKKEYLAIRRNLSAMAPKVKKFNESLMQRAAFMRITLEDLEIAINENGPVSEYKNGENQWGTKKSPEVEVYTTMAKNYAAIMKQLLDLIPKEEEKPHIDEFDKFVVSR